MADDNKTPDALDDFWYDGKVTRRKLIGYGAATAGALGATMLVPAPWQAAFGQAKPFKIGTSQPLSGAGAAGGKTALVGIQMAADHINKSGGINGRPVELVIADDESKPDVARRKTQKMVSEDNIDVHVGGFLSNICLACMPVWEEAKIVNMISVCLDTTLTTTKCNRYSFRVHDYAPAQAVAFGPTLAKMGKKWHLAYADYSWGQSTRDAYAAEIKKNGGTVVGTTGIPLGTADMTPFLSKIKGDFDGLFGIFFGKDGVTIGNQAYDLGLTKKYKWAGDGAICESTNLPALGNKIDGFVAINRYIPVFQGALDTPHHKKFFDDAKARLAKVVEKNDKNVGAHVLLGMVLNSEGKTDAANKEYRKVLTLSPKHPLAANNLAANLADGGGNLDEALKFAQIAREAAPEDPSVGDTLGWVYYKKGLFETAYPLIADAAGKLKNNASIRYHHGMVLAKKGKNKEAAAELNAALSLDPKFPGADEAKKTLEGLK